MTATTRINGPDDLAVELSTEESTEQALSKMLHRNTICGAWLTFTEDGIALGSIVEGALQDTDTHRLSWPFSIKAFRRAIKSIEDEASKIWNSTHGCPDCYPNGNDEPTPINPSCESCAGEGAVA